MVRVKNTMVPTTYTTVAVAPTLVFKVFTVVFLMSAELRQFENPTRSNAGDRFCFPHFLEARFSGVALQKEWQLIYPQAYKVLCHIGVKRYFLLGFLANRSVLIRAC
jgi:hypothetical protein